MKVQKELQLTDVTDEVLALTAVVRPILKGALYTIPRQISDIHNGYENIPLFLLPRLRKESDGDVGICFEYAVHEALIDGEPLITEKICDGLKKCKINTSAPHSILFAIEKNGALNVIETAKNTLTDDSQLQYGTRGRPAKLRRHIDLIASAFKNRQTKPALPYSINGLWKADLFLGSTQNDQWVGTTVKVNPRNLESAKGLRLGIVPSKQGRSDKIIVDGSKNLVICPLPHDEAFMQVFYEGWNIVQSFLRADANMPKEVNLPRPPHRQVAKFLYDRRKYPVLDVIEALDDICQPELMISDAKDISVDVLSGDPGTRHFISPVGRIVSS